MAGIWAGEACTSSYICRLTHSFKKLLALRSYRALSTWENLDQWYRTMIDMCARLCLYLCPDAFPLQMVILLPTLVIVIINSNKQALIKTIYWKLQFAIDLINLWELEQFLNIVFERRQSLEICGQLKQFVVSKLKMLSLWTQMKLSRCWPFHQQLWRRIIMT